MESGMLEPYDECSYSSSVHSRAYSTEGSHSAQTSPDYDSKCSSNENDDDRWLNVKNINLMKPPCKEELSEIDSDDDVARSSCDENEVGDGMNQEHNVTEETVDIDSDDYEIEYEYFTEDMHGAVEIIEVMTVDPDQDCENSDEEDSQNVVSKPTQIGQILASPGKEACTDPASSICEFNEEYTHKEVVQIPTEEATQNNIKQHKEFSIEKPFEGNVNVEDFFLKNDSKPVWTTLHNELTVEILSPSVDISSDDFRKLFCSPTKPGKSFQKSFSLPQSPSHLPKEGDPKSSLCFEDLNLHDITDLNFSLTGADLSGNKIFDMLDLSVDDDDEIRTLNDDDVNSFLITDPKKILPSVVSTKETMFETFDNDKNDKINDDLNQQDMEIECPVNSHIEIPSNLNDYIPQQTSTPIQPAKFSPVKQKSSTVLDFCIEKSKKEPAVVKVKREIKIEQDDYVDVESLNDSIELPVLEANNVSSLLEQFEATEKFNHPPRKAAARATESHANKDIVSKPLSNGLRLQEAAVQLNKNKMKQIMMPTPTPKCAASQKTMQDHDYCSPSKRPPAIQNAAPKRRQSLLKPEVVSSNHIIKNSRHRTCKNKRVVYTLSSDDEDNTNKQSDNKDLKNSLISNYRKKLSPEHNTNTQFVKPKPLEVELGKVIKSASDPKLSNNTNSQCSGGSIKLTIKNKTKVILKLDGDENKTEITEDYYISHENKKKDTDKQSAAKVTNENSLLKSYNKIETSKSIKEFKPQVDTVVKKELKSHIDTMVKKETKSKICAILKKDIKPNSDIVKKVNKLQMESVERNPSTQSETFVKTMEKSVKAVNKKDTKLQVEPVQKDNLVTIVKKEATLCEPIKQKETKPQIKPSIQNPPAIQVSQCQPYYRNRDPLGLMVDIELEKSKKCEINHSVPLTIETTIPEIKQPVKKKLNLLEYKMRLEGNSNNSSRNVSPEVSSLANQDIFCINPAVTKDKFTPPQISPGIIHGTPSSTNTSTRSSPKDECDQVKKLFDPIREASMKVLMHDKKCKANALSKREEDMIKIPKVENLELKPLISDVEILQIVSMAQEIIQKRINSMPELPKSSQFEEISMVSFGTNTEPVFDKMPLKNNGKIKETCPSKGGIHFTIKKPEQNSLLKQNVFDSKKNTNDIKHNRRSSSPRRDSKSESKTQQDKHMTTKDTKIDKERFKDITATLKSVESNTDVKISSNSLFASIQDVVMKKAPETSKPGKKETTEERKRARSEDGYETSNHIKRIKTILVNECPNEDHGEDKVILHLPIDRVKPESSTVEVQTDANEMFEAIKEVSVAESTIENSALVTQQRSRNDSIKSSASVASAESVQKKSVLKNYTTRRSVSRDNKDVKSRRSIECRKPYRRSYSRSRSRSRHRSRSHDRRSNRNMSHRRRSRSPYRNRSRSPYRNRPDRHSPSYKRSERRYRSRSRHMSPARKNWKSSRSPVKKLKSPEKEVEPPALKREKTPDAVKETVVVQKRISPAVSSFRNKTISESSDSSSSSSSSNSSSSSSSSGSSGSRRSSRSRHSYYTPSPARSNDRGRLYSRESSQDRQCIPPVEERRIVYVGKLETDITKSGLRATFSRFGPITEVTLHTKDNGSRYGFVTFRRGRDAWSAVEAARGSLSRYDVGFGGRRAFCRQRYADLDGLEAEYRESDYHGLPAQLHQTQDVSFEALLQETKNKLNQLKTKKSDTTI